MSSTPIRAVITGGPGAGKSTLLGALGAQGIAVFPEVARAILQLPGGMAMRAERPLDFAVAMLEAEQHVWAQSSDGLSVLDRGFPDIVGFLELEGRAVPSAVDRICCTHLYSGPIFHAPPWRNIYRRDEERIQSWEQAIESDKAVVSAWRLYGYALIELPQTDVENRVEFVMEHLKAVLACDAG